MRSLTGAKAPRVVFPPRSKETGIPNIPSSFLDIKQVADRINYASEDIFLCCAFGINNKPRLNEMVFYRDSSNVVIVGTVHDIEKDGIVCVDAENYPTRRFSAKNKFGYRTTRSINGCHSLLYSVEKALDAIDRFNVQALAKTMHNPSKASASIRLSEISSMSPEDQKAAIQKLLRQACNPTETELASQLQAVNAEIAQYENKYGIPSSELRQNLRSGQLQETHEICSWLILLKTRDASEENPYCPGSAEYKALERLRNPCGEDEWVVLVDEGDEVDLDDAIARLKTRGYDL